MRIYESRRWVLLQGGFSYYGTYSTVRSYGIRTIVRILGNYIRIIGSTIRRTNSTRAFSTSHAAGINNNNHNNDQIHTSTVRPPVRYRGLYLLRLVYGTYVLQRLDVFFWWFWQIWPIGKEKNKRQKTHTKTRIKAYICDVPHGTIHIQKKANKGQISYQMYPYVRSIHNIYEVYSYHRYVTK